MQLQTTPYTCGPAALVNALGCIGQRLTEQAAAKLARTNVAGTDDNDMLHALRALEYETHVINTKDEDAAWHLLHSQLVLGRPVLLAVEKDTHWAAAVGLLGERVLVADSADGDVIKSWEPDELLKWWRGKGRKPTYYGIAVVG